MPIRHCHSVSKIYWKFVITTLISCFFSHSHFEFSLATSHLQNVNINKRAIDDAASYYSTCGQVNGVNEVVWALKALQLTDLTTLAGDDTAANVRRLCIRAAYPFTDNELKYLDADIVPKIHTAAVCVYPNRVHDAYEALNSLELGKEIEIAAGRRSF